MNGHDAMSFTFGTKAETLERLAPFVTRSEVLDLLYFTVEAWGRDGEALLGRIQERFPDLPIALRSSTRAEDRKGASLAGAFRSCLNVSSGDRRALRAAIEAVIASFPGDPEDQVLVQPMVLDVALCGVIMTHDLATGAPYYIINYDDESGRTDRITGGQGVNKTVVIHRDCALAHVESQRIGALLEMTRELEQLCGARHPLDIEFATRSDGRIILLQLRQIAVQRNWNRRVQLQITEAVLQVERFVRERGAPRPDLEGSRTVLGQMPDWNPAELLGTMPRPLALSLFRHLISDSVWQEARARMGYRPVPGEALVVALGGHPYVDVRNSFNSFLPAGLAPRTGGLLVDAWLDRLAENPELHDKVEFQVAQTVVDFGFDGDHQARYGGLLDPDSFRDYRERLAGLTRGCLAGESLPWALDQLRRLEALQAEGARRAGAGRSPLWAVRADLEACRTHGTLPFAMIARHAFVAEVLLRSAVARGALAQERLDAFKRSITSIARELSRDHDRVRRGGLEPGAFLARFGHLRPGTFDLLSPRYDQRPDLFEGHPSERGPASAEPFQLLPGEASALGRLMAEAGLGGLEPGALMAYAGVAIAQRENAKFVFTRTLSAALENIAEWGEGLGLSRDDLSYLSLPDILETLNRSFLEDQEFTLRDLVEARRREAAVGGCLRLGYIIRSAADLYVVPLHRSAPNFVGRGVVTGRTVALDSRSSGSTDLFGKIVCVENADPGFDWIFTRGILGLLTMFGGANSHMTIRCAELGLPAAIGIGEQTYLRMVQSGRVELDCTGKILRPIHD